GDGLRATKKVGSTTTTFTWGSVGLLSDGTAYLYGPGDLPVEQISGTTVNYYVHDQLGSTVALTNSSGAVSATYCYDTYGRVTAPTGTVSTPLQYGAGYTDADTGLIYLQARYYDPATGQFLTIDPVVARTLSAYGYVDENPLNATDPTGLCSWYNLYCFAQE